MAKQPLEVHVEPGTEAAQFKTIRVDAKGITERPATTEEIQDMKAYRLAAGRAVIVDDAVKAARARGVTPTVAAVDMGDHVLLCLAGPGETADEYGFVAPQNREASSSLPSSLRVLEKLGYDLDAPATIPIVLRGAAQESQTGEEVKLYVRRLDAAGLQQFAAWTSRGDGGALDVMDLNSITQYNAACLYCAVAADPAGEIPFFTYAQALVWAKARKKDGSRPAEIFQLLATVLKANPCLAPNSREALYSANESAAGGAGQDVGHDGSYDWAQLKKNTIKSGESNSMSKPKKSEQSAGLPSTGRTPA